MEKSNLADLNPFISRLVRMLNSPEVDEIIRWSEDGRDIHIPDTHKLEGILSRFDFDTDQFSTFHRQMNQYGFKKRGQHFRHEKVTRDNPESWTFVERTTPKKNKQSMAKRVEQLEREKKEIESTVKKLAKMLVRLHQPGLTPEQRHAITQEWKELEPQIPLTPLPSPGTPALGPIVKAEPISPPGHGSFVAYPVESHISPQSDRPPYEAPRSPLDVGLAGLSLSMGLGSTLLAPEDAASATDQLSEILQSTLYLSDSGLGITGMPDGEFDVLSGWLSGNEK